MRVCRRFVSAMARERFENLAVSEGDFSPSLLFCPGSRARANNHMNSGLFFTYLPEPPNP